jgi:hypothetical protein
MAVVGLSLYDRGVDAVLFVVGCAGPGWRHLRWGRCRGGVAGTRLQNVGAVPSSTIAGILTAPESPSRSLAAPHRREEW